MARNLWRNRDADEVATLLPLQLPPPNQHPTTDEQDDFQFVRWFHLHKRPARRRTYLSLHASFECTLCYIHLDRKPPSTRDADELAALRPVLLPTMNLHPPTDELAAFRFASCVRLQSHPMRRPA
jgi:hypothetical protein